MPVTLWKLSTKSVDLFFDAALSSLRKHESFDILTYVPLKPKENKYDRFVGLKLEKNSKDGMKLQRVLEFNKNFSQKGNNFYRRKENVKGAFNVISDRTKVMQEHTISYCMQWLFFLHQL